MANHQRSRRGRGLAVRLAIPLLAFALTHCGGKANAPRAAATGESTAGESAAGESSTEPSANGGSSAADSAGQAGRANDSTIVLPTGGSATTLDCNTLDDPISPSTATIFAANPPEPQGGAISNGIYRLTKREDYVGPGGDKSRAPNSASGMLAITQSTEVSADVQITWMELSGELPTHTLWSETVAVTGTTYAYTVTCPTRDSTETGSLSFTATADELIWFAPLPGGGTRVQTFEREQ
jgi:hypothetical protein